MRLSPSLNSTVLVVLAGIFAVLPLTIQAADESPLEALRADSDIAKALEKLDSNLFADRNEASRTLEDAGKSAIGSITDAALGNSREVTLRCLDILKKHFVSDDDQLKEAAQEALQKIAESDHEAAAHRAKEVLDPKPAQRMNPAPGLQIMPGQIQIRINAMGGGQARRIQINNGVKNIEIEENGQKIKITDDPAKGIEMEVIEKKDGKETTKKYSAKSADELKKKHPEAFKLYDKHAKQMGGGIQIQALQVQPGVPLRVPAVPVPAAQRRSATAMLKHAERMIEMSSRSLERLKEGADDKKKLEESIKRLAEIQKQLKEEHAKLSEG